MDKTPRTVITSKKAKEHIFQARSLMDEMNLSIALQRQKLEGEQLKSEEASAEQQKVEVSNQHEMSMQQQQLAIKGLL